MFTMYMAKVSKKADITQKVHENLFLHEEPLGVAVHAERGLFIYYDQPSYPISAEKEKSPAAAHDIYDIRRNLTSPQ